MSTANLEAALTLRAHVDQFSTAVQSASADFRRAMGDVEGSAGEAGAATTEAGRGATELGNASGAAAGNVDRLGQAAGGTASQARTLGEAFGEVKANLAAASVALGGVTLWLGNASGKSAEFGRSMAEVSTLLDDTSMIPRLTEDVRRLSRELGGDVQRNSKALYDIISAGAADAAAAVDTLTAANKLAIGGVTDVGVAADGLTSTMNAYGEAAGSATEVSDAFFTAVKAGKTTVGELAGSIGQVAPIAAQAGVGLEELLAGVATLTTGGVQTSVAMTQVRAAISSVIKPTAEARKLAAELGLEFDAAALKSKGLAEFLDDVARATGGNTEQMAQLFGSVEALGAVLSLTGGGAEKFSEILADMETRAGATEDAVGKMMDTPAARAARFRAAMNDMQMSVGDAVTAFSPLLELATGALQLFSDLPGPLRTTTAGVAALAIAIPALTLASRQLLIVWRTLRPFLAASTFSAMVGPVGAATAAIWAKVRALGALRVALASTGIGALVVGAGMLASKFIEAKHAAEEGDRAVSAMLAERPMNGPARAVEAVATQAERTNGLLNAMQRELRQTDSEGRSAASALQAAFNSVDVSSVDGIGELIADLDDIKARALVTGEQLQTAIADRLKGLSSRELVEFGISAEMAFNRVGGSAETLAQINDAVLAASFARLGLNAEQALGRVTPAAADAVAALDAIQATMDRLGIEGEQRMDALGTAIAAAVGRADTIAGLEALKAKVLDMADAGDLAGDVLGAALDHVDAKLRQVARATSPVEQAFRTLGVTSQAALDGAAAAAHDAFRLIQSQGTASARELQEAFAAYARAAIAANNGVVSETVRAEAAMLGLKVEADETGKVIVRSMSEAAAATSSVGDAADSSVESVRNLCEEVERLNDVQTDSKPQQGGESKKFDSPFAQVFNRAEQVGGLALKDRLQQIYDQFALTRSKIGTTSSGARDFFEILARLRKEVDDAQREKEAAGALYGSGRQQPAAEPQPGGTYNVSINIGSRRQTVRTASQGDAERLIEMLRELERAASVSP